MNILRNGTRFDAAFVQFLEQEQYLYIDILPKVSQTFKTFKGSIVEDCARF